MTRLAMHHLGWQCVFVTYSDICNDHDSYLVHLTLPVPKVIYHARTVWPDGKALNETRRRQRSPPFAFVALIFFDEQ